LPARPVHQLVSGVSAIPARIGFRSTYTLHANAADSSSSRWHLNRFSKKRPVQQSSRFARRAIGSARHRISLPTPNDFHAGVAQVGRNKSAQFRQKFSRCP
jgi:hypothetical protein